MTRLRLKQLTVIATAVTALAGGCAAFGQVPTDWLDLGTLVQPSSTPPAVPAPWGSREHKAPSKRAVLAKLERVDVIDERPDVAGYDRDCGTGHACSFGPAWTDGNADPTYGRQGCDTRNDILARDLRRPKYRAGTNDCVVESGVLHDPYTGQEISFTKTEAFRVGVDHLYPLSRAWDLGAADWSFERRVNFANDSRNLLAVSGSANSSKGDRGPGEWMPLNRSFACTYVSRYLTVARAYGLPITQADADSIKTTATAACPTTVLKDSIFTGQLKEVLPR